MIVWYFCRRFLCTFLLILIVLATVLSIVNIISKNVFSSPDLVIALFMGALPFVAAFVYPFALVCACLLELYMSVHRGDFVLISFFYDLQRKLLKSILLCGLIASLLFTLLVFWIAPKSYDWGKKLLYTVVEQKILTLTPGVLHFPVPGVGTYFDEIKTVGIDGNGTEFYNFFLIQENTKSLPRTINGLVWSSYATMSDKNLILEKGAVLGLNKQAGDPFFMAVFDRGILNLERFLFASKKLDINSFKYQTINELWEQNNLEARIERYKRYIQIGWVFITPLIAYFLTFTLVFQKITLLFLAAGGWFFALYLLLISLPLCFN